jgi:hypothetical protein
MSEAKKPEVKKSPAKTKVLTKRSIWVDQGAGKKAKKVRAGNLVELSKEEIKAFGSAVTKDFDEDEE